MQQLCRISLLEETLEREYFNNATWTAAGDSHWFFDNSLARVGTGRRGSGAYGTDNAPDNRSQ